MLLRMRHVPLVLLLFGSQRCAWGSTMRRAAVCVATPGVKNAFTRIAGGRRGIAHVSSDALHASMLRRSPLPLGFRFLAPLPWTREVWSFFVLCLLLSRTWGFYDLLKFWVLPLAIAAATFSTTSPMRAKRQLQPHGSEGRSRVVSISWGVSNA